jgi:hypothetical protein
MSVLATTWIETVKVVGVLLGVAAIVWTLKWDAGS